ncbi:MAG: phenylalanine--tRNA ligase subunit beta [Planctomycetota bacterium]|nr:MAG: phenylalanine--tRNA ligase subunit beta [Planctomycetota bacterium]
MKILLSWLNDYIDTGLSAEQIAGVLSDLGLSCESIQQLGCDATIELEITSNRGDCLSLIGVARELSAATGKPLKIPTIELPESDSVASDLASVEIQEVDLCPRYTARVIEGVKVGPSPDWLRNRLEAVGLRTVNNVVDATNYAMLETGQPPHAFDCEKITDGKIIVRKALPGERIVSIDGSKCDLKPDMLIIADPSGPVAIAGVMGGLHTEVSDTTTSILLEDAYFDPVSIRQTSRRLALPSEAAYRFERIVDIENIDWASKRTAQLIAQVAGGKVAKGMVDIYPKKSAQKQVTLRLSRLNMLLGIEVPPEQVQRILSALSLNPQQEDNSLVCDVPSWRSDIYREIDLIEEIARIYGLDKIPTEQKIQIEVVPVDARQKLTELAGTYLNGCGFYETINVTFLDNSTADLFTAHTRHLAVTDESRKAASLLRQTLLPSLFTTFRTNLNAGNSPCRVFEIADTYIPTEKSNALPIEKPKLALACDCDLRDLRGVIEGLIKTVDSEADILFEPAELLWAQTGAQIMVNGRAIGTAGLASQAVKDKFDFKDLTPAAAELDFEHLMTLSRVAVKVKPIPRFPAIQRDLSIVIDEKTSWARIAEAVNKKAPDQLQDLQFVGIYRAKGIPSGKKSLTLRLTFRDEDGTLTHETVDKFQNEILDSLTKSLGAELRTL